MIFKSRKALHAEICRLLDLLACVPAVAEDRERLMKKTVEQEDRIALLEKVCAGYVKRQTVYLAKATEICNENQRQAAEIAQLTENNDYLSKLLAERRAEVTV